MSKKFFITALIALAFAVAVSACAKKGGEDTIKIGIAGPMTGDQSKMGMDFKNGVELAVSEWNAKGGVLGKKIEMVVVDDQHDPKQAVSIANKLVNEGVVGVVGHFNSSCSIPSSKIYMDGCVPMITPATTNPTYTEQGCWNVFRVCGRDDQQGKAAADFVLGTLKKTKVAVLHDKTTYGQGIADEFKKNLGDKAQVVYYGSIIQGDRDFKSVLTSIKSSSPEVIYFGGIYPEGGLLIKQARELGLNSDFISGDGCIDPKFVEIGGKSAEGAYLTFSPDPQNIETARTFLETYHKKYGPHGPYSIYAYDATNVLLKAINDTGSTEGKAIANAIHKGMYGGALGEVQFDAKGDNKIAHYVIWQVKDGGFVQVTK